MITKQTVVDQIEVTRDNHIQLRFALELVEDGIILNKKWHRTAIMADGDVTIQMQAVNDHLTSMNESVVSQIDIDRIISIKSVL